MKYDFKKLQKILTGNGFRLNESHWEVADKNGRNHIVREIFTALGDNRAYDSRFRLRKRKTCGNPLCVNPNCWEFIETKTLIKGSSFLDYEDFKDACNDFDLDECEKLGLESYLEIYNEDLPDFLKLTAEQMKEVYIYVKKNNDK